MTNLIQCVPNFSEGRRPEVVQAIVQAAESAGSAKVVDYSMDVDHNRSVVTIFGEAEAVKAAVLAAAAKAVQLIDMRKHAGEHPRIGAIDVVPLIPIRGITMEECVALSYDVGNEIAESLEIPVYFYEESAQRAARRNLAAIRRGGFEAINERELTGNYEPDAGPSRAHRTAGAVVVGARGPLIAFNVNLKTDDLSVANAIARDIRRMRDDGKGMAGVKAIGVYLASRGIAQVSANITRPDLVSMHEVYSFVETACRNHNVEVLESELIGVVRQQSIVQSYCHSIRLSNLPESRILDSWMSQE